MSDLDAAEDARADGERTVVSGTAISAGVGLGRAWIVVDALKATFGTRPIARDEIAIEWSRIRTALAATRRELDDSATRVEEQFDATLAGIFRAHAMMLDGILAS